MKKGIIVGIFVFCFFLSAVTGQALAGDPDAPNAIDTGLVVSATRYEMPENQISSDITVVTKEEISHLPARNLGEALNYTTGLVFDKVGGPVSSVFPSIRGSEYRHVKISIDDIPMELLSGDLTDLALFPVENVERVEILKGSASSVWGSSLGGVINIITREPSDKPQQEIGVSLGEKSTDRYYGSLSGRAFGTGYFLSASKFTTDGFFAKQDTDIKNLYGKLTKELNSRLRTELSYGYNDNERGLGILSLPSYNINIFSNFKSKDSYGRLKFAYVPYNDLDMSVSFYKRYFRDKREDTNINTGSTTILTNHEDKVGTVMKLGWRHSERDVLSAGIEASHDKFNLNILTKEYDTDKKAVYINESYGLGRLDTNIGARFDDDSVFGSEISPMAGLVYKIEETTLLRLNAARGFTPPSPSLSLSRNQTQCRSYG